MNVKFLLTIFVLSFFTCCEKDKVATTSIETKVPFNKFILGSWVNYQNRFIIESETQWPSWVNMVEEKYYSFKSDLTYNYFSLGVNFSDIYEYNASLNKLSINKSNQNIIDEYHVVSYHDNEFIIQQQNSGYKIQSRFIRNN